MRSASGSWTAVSSPRWCLAGDRVRNNTGEAFNAHYSATREVVTEPFVIYRDAARQVVVPPGSYSFGETVLSPRRPAASGSTRVALTWRRGDFLSGSRTNLVGDFSWKQSRRFALGFRYDWNDIEPSARPLHYSPHEADDRRQFLVDLYWVTLIQYDNVSEIIGVNTRLNWIPKAGQEGLIVLNHSLEDRDRDDSFKSELLDLSVKLSYTFRF